MEYVENRIAIAKLEGKQKIADIASTIAALVPALLFGLFALTFLSLALAQAINVWLTSIVWGFLIVGVLYGILAAVMFSMRDSDWLKKKIVDGSTKFLKEKPAKEGDQEAEQPTGYHSDAVEHKKIVFEDADDTSDADVSTADREHFKDREPVSKVQATPSTSNSTIIVESDKEDKQPS